MIACTRFTISRV